MMKPSNKHHLQKKIPELISDSGAIPGIKVDTGAKFWQIHLMKKLQKVWMD